MGRCRCSSTVCPQTKPDPNPVGGLLRATASRSAGLAPLALRFGSIPRAACPPHFSSRTTTAQAQVEDQPDRSRDGMPIWIWCTACPRNGGGDPAPVPLSFLLHMLSPPCLAGIRCRQVPGGGQGAGAEPNRAPKPPRTTWRNRTRHHPLTPSTSGRRAYAAITRAWEVMLRNCETFLLKGTCPSRVVFSAAPGVQRLA